MITWKYIYTSIFFLLFSFFFFGEEDSLNEQLSSIKLDSAKIKFWNITNPIGEITPINSDTFLTDFFNKKDIEGKGISIAYLGNFGSPAHSRFFFERAETSLFLFQNAYSFYRKTPSSFNFINTNIPYSTITYQRDSEQIIKNEIIQSLLSFNLGKKINLGIDVEYLYSPGYYQAQSVKYLDLVYFGNYISNHHQFHYFINFFNHTNAENGGIIDSIDVHSHYPRDKFTYLSFGENSTWNTLLGNHFFFNYHYNLKLIDDSKNQIKENIPIFAAIYTLEYNNCQKRFYTDDSAIVSNFYIDRKDNFINRIGGVNDSVSYSSINNTFGFSIKEGFSKWIKFGCVFFLKQDFRFFSTMNTTSYAKQTITYIGSECMKRNGEKIKYYTQETFAIKGENKGDFIISVAEENSIPCWSDTIHIKIHAFLKNISPSYFENNYISKYFKWKNQFDKLRKIRLDFVFDISKTKSYIQFQFENISRLIFFNENGNPDQYNGNIQVYALSENQNFKIQSYHLDNQIVYQLSSCPLILPLPNFICSSNSYFQFKVANTLLVQAGINVHFHTKYYSPSYEPAIQQFKLQHNILLGNSLINGFLNCKIKQTRFFIKYYNVGEIFRPNSNYFLLPHYPIPPSSVKVGLSINFFN